LVLVVIYFDILYLVVLDIFIGISRPSLYPIEWYFEWGCRRGAIRQRSAVFEEVRGHVLRSGFCGCSSWGLAAWIFRGAPTTPYPVRRGWQVAVSSPGKGQPILTKLRPVNDALMKSQILASQCAVSTNSLPSNGHKNSTSRQVLWRAPYAPPGQCQELL
jgi:hypothetical protein